MFINKALCMYGFNELLASYPVIFSSLPGKLSILVIG